MPASFHITRRTPMAKKPKTVETPLDPETAELLGVDPADAPAERPAEAPAAELPPEPLKPAELVADDTVLDAHKRRQENWEADAAKLFRGPSIEEQEREALLNALSAKDAEDIKERRKADEAREAAMAEEAKAARQKRAAELRAEADAIEGV
jgi:hypothetical protein